MSGGGLLGDSHGLSPEEAREVGAYVVSHFGVVAPQQDSTPREPGEPPTEDAMHEAYMRTHFPSQYVPDEDR